MEAEWKRHFICRKYSKLQIIKKKSWELQKKRTKK